MCVIYIRHYWLLCQNVFILVFSDTYPRWLAFFFVPGLSRQLGLKIGLYIYIRIIPDGLASSLLFPGNSSTFSIMCSSSLIIIITLPFELFPCHVLRRSHYSCCSSNYYVHFLGRSHYSCCSSNYYVPFLGGSHYSCCSSNYYVHFLGRSHYSCCSSNYYVHFLGRSHYSCCSSNYYVHFLGGSHYSCCSSNYYVHFLGRSHYSCCSSNYYVHFLGGSHYSCCSSNYYVPLGYYPSLLSLASPISALFV